MTYAPSIREYWRFTGIGVVYADCFAGRALNSYW
jgi:hypothetical protein